MLSEEISPKNINYYYYYITCSDLARRDGNYLRRTYVVLHMACQRPCSLLDFNALNLLHLILTESI